MKNIRRAILKGMTVAILTAGLASASTISYTAIVGSYPTSFTTGAAPVPALSLQGFNSSLGTLTGVSLTLDALFAINLTVGNYSDTFFTENPITMQFDAPQTETYYNASAMGTAAVTGPGGLSLSISPSTISESDLSPGLLSAGTSPTGYQDTYNGLAASGTATANPVDLSDYINSGFLTTISFSAGSLQAHGSSSFGDIFYNVNGAASGSVEVTYTYNAAPVGGAPEPASIFLMGSALLGVGLLRKPLTRS
jgi:hypothetical protein